MPATRAPANIRPVASQARWPMAADVRQALDQTNFRMLGTWLTGCPSHSFSIIAAQPTRSFFAREQSAARFTASLCCDKTVIIGRPTILVEEG